MCPKTVFIHTYHIYYRSGIWKRQISKAIIILYCNNMSCTLCGGSTIFIMFLLSWPSKRNANIWVWYSSIYIVFNLLALLYLKVYIILQYATCMQHACAYPFEFVPMYVRMCQVRLDVCVCVFIGIDVCVQIGNNRSDVSCVVIQAEVTVIINYSASNLYVIFFYTKFCDVVGCVGTAHTLYTLYYIIIYYYIYYNM